MEKKGSGNGNASALQEQASIFQTHSPTQTSTCSRVRPAAHDRAAIDHSGTDTVCACLDTCAQGLCAHRRMKTAQHRRPHTRARLQKSSSTALLCMGSWPRAQIAAVYPRRLWSSKSLTSSFSLWLTTEEPWLSTLLFMARRPGPTSPFGSLPAPTLHSHSHKHARHRLHQGHRRYKCLLQM